MLATVNTAAESIKTGKSLIISGEEALLAQLPCGNWIGGTIPYFMDQQGGTMDKTKVFITELPGQLEEEKIKLYKENELSSIPKDAFENGVSFIIIPATSTCHVRYAQEAPNFPDIFLHPIIGWISGVHLDELGKRKPKVFNGKDGSSHENAAIVLHGRLSERLMAKIGIVNVFEPNGKDTIVFEKEGFSVDGCLVNGIKKNFATYLKETGADTRLPLVADYSGSMVNVSIQTVHETSVDLYAPVFTGVRYQLAKKISSYIEQFSAALPKNVSPVFSCNCILNYLHSELEGKVTKGMYGPITFGEIAYQLLNQTLVYLEIDSL
ncbi:MAG: hypothetical protein RBT62_11345 [Spirochaetia bacterium]|jgi:hypothetical protein|nr:hypothetical protein [Spirochaetia bacterium]